MSTERIQIFEKRDAFAKEMMQKYANHIQTKIVSDIGSGFGRMQQPVEELGFFWQPFDYVDKIPEATIWDLNNPPPKSAKKASCVLLLEVLEHFANPLLVLENIANHMEKNGVLILTTPNPQSSKNILHLLSKGSLYSFQPKHLEEHHVFTPWEHIVRFFLEKCRFELKEYAIIDVDYQYRKAKNVKDFFKKRLESFLENRNPKAAGMSYGIVAVKS